MAMTPEVEAEIAFFFTHGGECQRSTMGPMLHRAEILREDSAGNRLEPMNANWAWRPGGEDQTMVPSPTHSGEPSYVPEMGRYELFGRASRRMRAVERHLRQDALILEAYYGDRGNRWREAARDQFNEAGRVERKGYGPGAIAAVYRFTKEGRALILRQRVRLLGDGKELGSADDVLASILAEFASRPTPELKKRLAKIRTEATALLVRACSAYLTAIAREQRKAQRERLPIRPGKVLVVRREVA